MKSGNFLEFWLLGLKWVLGTLHMRKRHTISFHVYSSNCSVFFQFQPDYIYRIETDMLQQTLLHNLMKMIF